MNEFHLGEERRLRPRKGNVMGAVKSRAKDYGVVIEIDDPEVRSTVSGVIEDALIKAGFIDVENLVVDGDGDFVELAKVPTLLDLLKETFLQVFENRITISSVDTDFDETDREERPIEELEPELD